MDNLTTTNQPRPSVFRTRLWSRETSKKLGKFLLILFLVPAALITIKDEALYWLAEPQEEAVAVEEPNAEEENKCNVTGINVHGEMVTYIPLDEINDEGESIEDQTASEDVLYYIKQAEENQKIKAIILEIDSYGGSAVAGEEISSALKRAKKPTVVFVRDVAASAAYLAASGASRIFASKYSDVGSIGVTMSYIDETGKNRKEGLAYIQLSTGKFKDAGDPNRTLTAEEQALFMRNLNITHKHFIADVAVNRKLHIQKVEALADGSTMPGEMALANGLIDGIGGLEEAKEYIQGIIGEKPEVCF